MILCYTYKDSTSTTSTETTVATSPHSATSSISESTTVSEDLKQVLVVNKTLPYSLKKSKDTLLILPCCNWILFEGLLRRLIEILGGVRCF